MAQAVNRVVLADFEDYRSAQQRAVATFTDRRKWNEMSLMNIAGSGRFAADRAINEYARDIWHTESAFTDDERLGKAELKAKADAKQAASKKAKTESAKSAKAEPKKAAPAKKATPSKKKSK